ncbi:MAG: response regulator [Deltaproteobacteria bacterium]|nr:response regulator [Deltaproteobacteria bacterium]
MARWRHWWIVPLSAAIVGAVGFVQIAIILDKELRVPFMVAPMLVGATFGYLIRRVMLLKEQLAEFNDNLAKLVDERTRELQATQQQLHHAQRLEAIGRLAAGVAHDFNNLLTAIIGGTDLALRRTSDERDKAALRDVLLAAERGAGLTQQLLQFGRPSGSEARVVDLNEIVEDMLPMLRLVVGEVPIDWQPGAEVPRVEADEGQLGQVAVNLVINARDATTDGRAIVLSTGSVARNGELRACITVADQGVGMDESTRERVLEPFFTTKPVGQGTGLGLSVAYGIVRDAGGEIRFASTPGEGTEVTVELPASDKNLPPAGDPERAPAEDSGGLVLVVDDDELVRTVVVRSLQASGYEVLAASDGRGALSQLSDCQGTIDLLLCDVSLGNGESGYDVARRLREQDSDLAVVFMSGYADPVSGAQDITDEPVLGKPFDAVPLTAACRRALSNAAAARRG